MCLQKPVGLSNTAKLLCLPSFSALSSLLKQTSLLSLFMRTKCRLIYLLLLVVWLFVILFAPPFKLLLKYSCLHFPPPLPAAPEQYRTFLNFPFKLTENLK